MADPLFDHPGLEVDVAQLRDALDRDAVTLVDVREPYEWEAGRIPGAVHVALHELGARANELDRSRPIVFQCRVGGRSAMAAQAFREAGVDAWSLRGGILDWAAAGHPLTPEDGTVADH
ncbi:rhodanese-like domain-containing protein [Patulibacter defluvii]|uniref:rhodanese-like domain-containing protein n=1 Tax=Patulibacter defluvii TaxID=3095358 RepID=UPI002A747760|nr:rhodanese-like domain-containing protein [Patulibacter sp. DM4]